jgi:hypothetical protein
MRQFILSTENQIVIFFLAIAVALYPGAAAAESKANPTGKRIEKDSDGDGKPDLWFYYRDGRAYRIEEDVNRDGKPDLWEDYDESDLFSAHHQLYGG